MELVKAAIELGGTTAGEVGQVLFRLIGFLGKAQATAGAPQVARCHVDRLVGLGFHAQLRAGEQDVAQGRVASPFPTKEPLPLLWHDDCAEAVVMVIGDVELMETLPHVALVGEYQHGPVMRRPPAGGKDLETGDLAGQLHVFTLAVMGLSGTGPMTSATLASMRLRVLGSGFTSSVSR